MSCELCKTCDGCYCPRCPKNPNPVDQCLLCGLVNCGDHSKDTTLSEHYECNIESFCQICVETEHGFRFKFMQRSMYCDAHEDAHKQRSREEFQQDVKRRT